MANNSKKVNYESLKFLAILAAIFIIILIIYFISRGSGAKNPPIDVGNTPIPSQEADGTPAPTILPDETPVPTTESTPVPTDMPASATPEPTEEVTPTVVPADPTETPSPTPTRMPAPTPAVAIKSSEAKKALETIVDPSLYTINLLSGNFSPNGDGEVYFRFSVTDKATGKQMQPEMLVHSITASIYCYQDGKVFDCVQFPLDDTEIGGNEPIGDRKITALEAVQILMTYGREQLKLPNDPSHYTAKVDEVANITLADADGVQAYLIYLLEDNTRVMGAYAVSEDGVFVYIRDEMDPNIFERIVEG